MSSTPDGAIGRAAAAIREADALVIGAGAGLGVDSGLPDFRGNEGFWRNYPPFRAAGLSFVDMANPAWFERDPELAWGFYGHRLELYRTIAPHAGYTMLRDIGARMAHGAVVYSSNVDGHFMEAGFAEAQVVECHGSLRHLQCVRACTPDIWPVGDRRIDVDETTFRAIGALPACRQCGGLARPNVLMFGDSHWVSRRTDEQYRRYAAWLGGLPPGTALVKIELGAGTAVPSVRFELEAQPGTLIRINPRETDVPNGAIGIACGALEAMERIAAMLNDR